MLRYGFKKSISFFIFIVFLSFTLDTDQYNYDISFKKTLKKISNNLYEIEIDIDNGGVVDGIAKYEAKIPLSADFVKEVSKDNGVNFKVDKRKIKVIWMHMRKNNNYSTVFQIRTNKSIEKLKMVGDFHGHNRGAKFAIKDTASFVIE
jgi:hypothetical protein